MQNEEMNIFIPLEPYLDDSNLSGDKRDKRYQILMQYNLLEERDNEIFIHLPRYTKFAIADLEDYQHKALENPSSDDISQYVSAVKLYIRDWNLFLSYILDFAVDPDKINQRDGIKIIFNDSMSDYQKIFKHLCLSLELTFNFALSKEQNKTGNQ